MKTGGSIVTVNSSTRQLAFMLAKAFADDPVMAYIFPRLEGRLQRVESIMGLAIKTYAANGLIESLEGHSAAIWQRPLPDKPTLLMLLINSMEAIVRLRGALERAQNVQHITAQARIKEPHWYLAIIGTEPGYRGSWQGGMSLAGQLLHSALQRCDQQNLPAYLESSAPGNIGFYQRFGFEITGTLQLPDGPPMWAMLRQPGGKGF